MIKVISVDNQEIFLKSVETNSSILHFSAICSILKVLNSFQKTKTTISAIEQLLTNENVLTAKKRKQSKIDRLVTKIVVKNGYLAELDLTKTDRPSGVVAALGRNIKATLSRNANSKSEQLQATTAKTFDIGKFLDSFLTKVVATKANQALEKLLLVDLNAINSTGILQFWESNEKDEEKILKIIDRGLMRNAALILSIVGGLVKDKSCPERFREACLAKITSVLSSQNELNREKVKTIFKNQAPTKSILEKFEALFKTKLQPGNKTDIIDTLAGLKPSTSALDAFINTITSFINSENQENFVEAAKSCFRKWIQFHKFLPAEKMTLSKNTKASDPTLILSSPKLAKSRLQDMLIYRHGNNLNGVTNTKPSALKTADQVQDYCYYLTIKTLQNEFSEKEIDQFLSDDNVQRHLEKLCLSETICITFFSFSQLNFGTFTDQKVENKLVNLLLRASFRSNFSVRYLISFMKKNVDNLAVVGKELSVLRPRVEDLKSRVFDSLIENFDELKRDLNFQIQAMPNVKIMDNEIDQEEAVDDACNCFSGLSIEGRRKDFTNADKLKIDLEFVRLSCKELVNAAGKFSIKLALSF